ncbi:hypothetical protein IMG5_187120 [Ichthyophthirius multifiliis]|uniref:Uncharacterized protein n=1 Tax=Ichthyophthirius multifiliis TaxID=5932 RepID=G0R3T6_ICHMU|nr:hypothetical protein IMG5_187120 [Ichthyophthirius multifiliis]EGR27868.1 hypothetical protein IMG5_187120 [Ichthyophthirius multifiliis]|eukprot:XP_004027213.1 hypothetical protein IMG5_187120 [Ichthyophthirius multifiliis]
MDQMNQMANNFQMILLIEKIIKNQSETENRQETQEKEKNIFRVIRKQSKKLFNFLLNQKKVTSLSDILAESKKICQSSENLLNNLQNQIQCKNEQQTNKTILLSNLKNALNSNASESDIATIIDVLKKKFGSNNPDKLMILDYCFKQITEQMLPVHVKYILYAASENKDIFSKENEKEDDYNQQDKNQEPEFPKIIQSLQLSEKQKTKALKMQKKLTKENEKLEILVNQMYETKQKMKKELSTLDDTMQNLIKEFKPSQIAKFILNIEQSQHQSMMKNSFQKFFQADNQDSDDDSENDLQSFIQNQDTYNTLMVDVNEAYDVYTDAYEFLHKKRHLFSESTNNLQNQNAPNNNDSN